MTRKINAQKVSSHRSYSTREAADTLGLHIQTIRNWIRDGELACFKAGKQTFIPGRELKLFIQAQITNRKRPLDPGTLYCTTCHEVTKPAGELWQLEASGNNSQTIKAFCFSCEKLLTLFAGKKQVAEFTESYGPSS